MAPENNILFPKALSARGRAVEQAGRRAAVRLRARRVAIPPAFCRGSHTAAGGLPVLRSGQPRACPYLRGAYASRFLSPRSSPSRFSAGLRRFTSRSPRCPTRSSRAKVNRLASGEIAGQNVWQSMGGRPVQVGAGATSRRTADWSTGRPSSFSTRSRAEFGGVRYAERE
jgi:hypothetical protein